MRAAVMLIARICALLAVLLGSLSAGAGLHAGAVKAGTTHSGVAQTLWSNPDIAPEVLAFMLANDAELCLSEEAGSGPAHHHSQDCACCFASCFGHAAAVLVSSCPILFSLAYQAGSTDFIADQHQARTPPAFSISNPRAPPACG